MALTALPAPSGDDLVFLTTLMADMAIAKAAISAYSAQVVSWIATPLKSLMVLYVMVWGFAMMRGVVERPAADSFWRVLKMILVVTIAMEVGINVKDITDFVWEIPNELVGAFTPVLTWFSAFLPGWSTATGDFIMTMIVGIMSYVADFGQAMATPDAGAFQDAVALGLGALGTGFAGLAFAIIMVCKMSLAILLGLSPFFIVAILFERTKPIFDSWISAIITFMLTLLLLYLTCFLLFPILLKTIAGYYMLSLAQGGMLENKQGIQLMVLLGIYIAVLRQVTATAASIARGYAVSASGRWDSWDHGGKGSLSQQQNPGQTARQAGQ